MHEQSFNGPVPKFKEIRKHTKYIHDTKFKHAEDKIQSKLTTLLLLPSSPSQWGLQNQAKAHTPPWVQNLFEQYSLLNVENATSCESHKCMWISAIYKLKTGNITNIVIICPTTLHFKTLTHYKHLQNHRAYQDIC